MEKLSNKPILIIILEGLIPLALFFAAIEFYDLWESGWFSDPDKWMLYIDCSGFKKW